MKFKKSYIEQALELSKSNGDIRHYVLARTFNVTTSTITNWKKKYPAFKKAIEDGKKEYFNF